MNTRVNVDFPGQVRDKYIPALPSRKEDNYRRSYKRVSRVSQEDTVLVPLAIGECRSQNDHHSNTIIFEEE
jgi:hypothetical protein